MKRVVVLTGTFVAMLSLFGTASSTIWHVHPDSAISAIQAGIDSSSHGDTVLVYPVTYYENINFGGKNIVVGSLFLTTGDTSYISATVIDGDSSGSVVGFDHGEDSNALITGFTIQNGYAAHGGGIQCLSNSSPTITNNIIIDNTADHRGGGIRCYNSSPTIAGNTIAGNTALRACGGGILCIYNSSPTITGNTITGNTTDSLGGGIECVVNSSPTITGNTITGNTAAYAGGGIVSYESFPTITDNVITGNAADSVGGGIAFRKSSPTITHNTIEGNTAHSGGGIACDSSSSGTVDSCAILGNNGGGVYCDYTSSPEIHYCNITDNSGYGVKNMDSSVTVDAEYNWWGHESGPYHPVTNPGGLGDSVSDYVDYDPWTVGISEAVSVTSPIEFTLCQNSPNPFAGVTSIQWSIPVSCHTTLRVYNLAGQLVETLVNEDQESGNYTVDWNGKDNSGHRVVQGVYFYRLTAGDFTSTKKMVLIR